MSILKTIHVLLQWNAIEIMIRIYFLNWQTFAFFMNYRAKNKGVRNGNVVDADKSTLLIRLPSHSKFFFLHTFYFPSFTPLVVYKMFETRKKGQTFVLHIFLTKKVKGLRRAKFRKTCYLIFSNWLKRCVHFFGNIYIYFIVIISKWLSVFFSLSNKYIRRRRTI